MITILTALPTENDAWGFWGALREFGGAEAAWPLASNGIAAATGSGPEPVRAFLDSRQGRHFADDVVNGLAVGLSLPLAIEAAVARWIGWRIDRATSRDSGIPAGLPYLVGWVAHHELEADAAA